MNNKKCPACNYMNEENAIFCKDCGLNIGGDVKLETEKSIRPVMEPEPESTQPSPIFGIVVVLISVAVGLFAYAHRPVEGFMDAMQRANSWAFHPNAYYIIMFIDCVAGLFGILRIFKSLSIGGKGGGLDEIKKAKELLDAGAISAKEFERIKKSALER